MINKLNEKDQKIYLIGKNPKELKLKESKAILRDKKVASKIKLLKTIQKCIKKKKNLNKRLALDDSNELAIFTLIKITKLFTKMVLMRVITFIN